MLDLPWITVRGLHILKAFARADGPLTLGAVARETGVAPSRSARILRVLKAAGLIEPALPKGWKLSRPAGNISVLEAVEALGASRPRPEHCQADWALCENRGGCVLAPLCRQAHESLIGVFREHTLADLRMEAPTLP